MEDSLHALGKCPISDKLFRTFATHHHDRKALTIPVGHSASVVESSYFGI